MIKTMNKKIKSIILILMTVSLTLAETGMNISAAVTRKNIRNVVQEVDGDEAAEAVGDKTAEEEPDNAVNGLIDISEIANKQTEKQKAGNIINEPLDNAVPVVHYYEITDDGVITPGEEFTLKFVVYNPGVTSKLGNVRIFIEQEKDLVYPAYNRTNSLYLGYMNALSYTDGEITLQASKDINTSEVPVKIRVFYTDNYAPNSEYSIDALLPVSTYGKLSVDSIDMPSAMYVGSNNRLRIVYRNNGLSTINNVTLHINGESIENQEVSFGSIGSNTSMTNDAYAELLQQGNQRIQLYFTYTDSDGSEHETEPCEYELDVKPYNESSDGESGYIQERYRLNRNMTYGVLIVSVLLLINLLIRISAKMKKEKRKGDTP